MKFVNQYGTRIEVLELKDGYVTFKVEIEGRIHVDIDCKDIESFQAMIKLNGYTVA